MIDRTGDRTAECYGGGGPSSAVGRSPASKMSRVPRSNVT
jgi:hypothetical protein